VKKSFSKEVESLIASLRAMPEEDHIQHDAGTKGFGSLVEACVEKYHIGRQTPEEEILENWDRIIGKQFAGRCRPERITASGCLIIQVPNPILRRELIFLEEKILTALGSMKSCHHIHRIILKGGN